MGVLPNVYRARRLQYGVLSHFGEWRGWAPAPVGGPSLPTVCCPPRLRLTLVAAEIYIPTQRGLRDYM